MYICNSQCSYIDLKVMFNNKHKNHKLDKKTSNKLCVQHFYLYVKSKMIPLFRMIDSLTLQLLMCSKKHSLLV